MTCPTIYSRSCVRVLNKGKHTIIVRFEKNRTFFVSLCQLNTHEVRSYEGAVMRSLQPQNSRFFTLLLLFCCGQILQIVVIY